MRVEDLRSLVRMAKNFWATTCAAAASAANHGKASSQDAYLPAPTLLEDPQLTAAVTQSDNGASDQSRFQRLCHKAAL